MNKELALNPAGTHYMQPMSFEEAYEYVKIWGKATLGNKTPSFAGGTYHESEFQVDGNLLFYTDFTTTSQYSKHYEGQFFKLIPKAEYEAQKILEPKYKVGDILVDGDGDERKVLGVCGLVYFVSEDNNFEVVSGVSYTIQELEKDGFKLKTEPEEEEVEETITYQGKEYWVSKVWFDNNKEISEITFKPVKK